MSVTNELELKYGPRGGTCVFRGCPECENSNRPAAVKALKISTTQDAELYLQIERTMCERLKAAASKSESGYWSETFVDDHFVFGERTCRPRFTTQKETEAMRECELGIRYPNEFMKTGIVYEWLEGYMDLLNMEEPNPFVDRQIVECFYLLLKAGYWSVDHDDGGNIMVHPQTLNVKFIDFDPTLVYRILPRYTDEKEELVDLSEDVDIDETVEYNEHISYWSEWKMWCVIRNVLSREWWPKFRDHAGKRDKSMYTIHNILRHYRQFQRPASTTI